VAQKILFQELQTGQIIKLIAAVISLEKNKCQVLACFLKFHFNSEFFSVTLFRANYSPETVFLKLLRSPGIDYDSLCSLVGLYDNLIPTWFVALIDCSKIQAQKTITKNRLWP
jgi:hypothetical protein